MKNVYIAFRSMFLFYFISMLFGSILIFQNNILGGNQFQRVFVPALIFGILVAALPTILGFFKIKENTGAMILGGIVVNFLFYFLGYFLLDFFNITQGRVVFVLDSLAISVKGEGFETFGLLLISIISTTLSVIIDVLSKKK